MFSFLVCCVCFDSLINTFDVRIIICKYYADENVLNWLYECGVGHIECKYYINS